MAVTAKGVDYAFSHPSIDSLVTGGFTFAVRYLYPFSQNPDTKNLTLTEATTLNAALINGVVSNFESWASRALDGHDAGVDDARAAQAQHTACGGKLDRPIYFSVDFDAQPPDYPAVRAYMLGVASVIGLNRTGVYGSYSVVKWLLDNQLVTWAWQTYAWSGGLYDERCQLSQDQNGVSMGGGDVDIDTAHAADFGQWNWAGDVDMPLSDDDLYKIRQQLIIALDDKTHTYFTDEFSNSNKAVLAGVKTMLSNAFDQAALQRVIVAAIADALSAGIPVDTVKQAVQDALDSATIPVRLSGHAGNLPVTP
jgi:hypothetical protein